MGVHDVDLVNPTFLGRTEELLDQRVRDIAGLSIGRRIGETTPHVLGLATTELEVLHSLATTQVGDDLLLRPESGVQLLGRLRGRIDGGEGVLLVGVGGNRRQGSRQLQGVGTRRPDDVLCLDDPRGGDELHRAGDLLRRRDGVPPFPQFPQV